MKNLRALGVALAVATVVATVAWGVHVTATPPAVPAGEAATTYDPADPREVAGAARDLFYGTVLRRIGSQEIAKLPSQVYEVEVRHTFKGRLRGTVTVTEADGEPQPAAGSSYVFATQPWDRDETGLHALITGSDPREVPDLGAPASPLQDAPGSQVRLHSGGPQTVAEYWAWAVEQQDTSPST